MTAAETATAGEKPDAFNQVCFAQSVFAANDVDPAAGSVFSGSEVAVVFGFQA